MFKYLLVFIFIFSYQLYACKCDYESLEKYVSHSNKIFTGTPISSKVINPDTLKKILNKEKFSFEDFPYVEANFYVKDTLKGKVKEFEKINTDIHDCGVPITIGKLYVIFSETEKNKINICGGSRKIKVIDKYVDKINDLIKKQNEKAILK